MAEDVLTLNSGMLELELSPSIGGAISNFTLISERYCARATLPFKTFSTPPVSPSFHS
jgi:hypothetical protein